MQIFICIFHYFSIFTQLFTQLLPFIEFNQLQALLVDFIDILLHFVVITVVLSILVAVAVVLGVLEDVPVQTEVQVNIPLSDLPFPDLQLGTYLTCESEIYGCLKSSGPTNLSMIISHPNIRPTPALALNSAVGLMKLTLLLVTLLSLMPLGSP